MVNTSEPKTVNIGDLVQWAHDGVDQFDTPRRIRAMQMHDQQEWAFVEGSKTGMPVSELTVVTSASAVMEEAPPDPVASPLMSKRRKPSLASLSAQHAARTFDLPTGAGPGRQKRHFTAGIRVPPEKHTSRTSSLVVVLTFALGAIASAAGIYALDGMNRSPRPSPIETETPLLLPSPMPASPPAPVVVKTAPVVPNVSEPAMERPVQFELNTSEIWEVQTRLEWLGMQPGSPDGIPGYRTFNAVRRYEESRGQAKTGNVDRKLLEQLRGEPKW
jgi:peptidoglycan hydrolase-like protein with peptidoglycan-binding domain